MSYFNRDSFEQHESVSVGEINDFHLEDKSCIRGNHITSTLLTVSVVGWASQDCFLSLFELCDAFIPSTNHLTNAHLELNRLSTRN